MEAKVSVLLLVATGIGGWYCYVAFGVLIIAMLKNIRKEKEVKQENDDTVGRII